MCRLLKIFREYWDIWKHFMDVTLSITKNMIKFFFFFAFFVHWWTFQLNLKCSSIQSGASPVSSYICSIHYGNQNLVGEIIKNNRHLNWLIQLFPHHLNEMFWHQSLTSRRPWAVPADLFILKNWKLYFEFFTTV